MSLKNFVRTQYFKMLQERTI